MKKFRLLIIIFVLLGLVTACKPEKPQLIQNRLRLTASKAN